MKKKSDKAAVMTAGKSAIKKSRIKEGRELSKLYESIALNAVSKEFVRIENKLQLYFGELLNKSLSEYRHDVLLMESGLSARLSLMESKLTECSRNIEKVQLDSNEKYSRIQADLDQSLKKNEEAVSSEQQIRTDFYKKLKSREERRAVEVREAAASAREETKVSISALSNDMKVQLDEINRLRDNMDEL